MFNYVKKVTENSYLVALVDYFRILKALIILFLLFELCLLSLLFSYLNYVPNQNDKVLKETLAGFNSDAVKSTLRHLPFKMILPLFQALQKSLPISLSLCHKQ